MSTGKKHSGNSIFAKYPAIGTATLKNGTTVPTPYHNYDADALIIWGEADAEWVSSKIEGEWEPVLDSKSGKAQVALWVVDYRDTNINPYKEFIVVFTVRHKTFPAATASLPSPLHALRLFEDKVAYPYIYKLWLDEEIPVMYGRELIGCDKYLDNNMKVNFEKKSVSFEFNHVDGERNSPAAGSLCKANLKLRDQTNLGGLIGAYGFFRTLGMASGARGSWHVVTPPGVMPSTEKHNPVWDFVYETSPKFTPACDKDDIVYGGELADMKFTARIYQHDSHIRALLLAPHTFVPIKSSSSAE